MLHRHRRPLAGLTSIDNNNTILRQRLHHRIHRLVWMDLPIRHLIVILIVRRQSSLIVMAGLDPFLVARNLCRGSLLESRGAEERCVGHNANVDCVALADLRAIEIDLGEHAVVVWNDGAASATEEETCARTE